MNYAVVGMGRSGEAARRLLLRLGHSPDNITTFDEKPGVAEFCDPAQLLEQRKPQVFVVSPGYPLSKPWLSEAKKNGAQITSELSLASELLGTEKIIGITGSVGKSTTIALVGEGARLVDPNCFVGGNFGTPLCDYVIQRLEGLRPQAEWLILELSSFQLENCAGLKLDLGAITYLGPNHLERYRDLEDYYMRKWSLFGICRGPVFLNRNGGALEAFLKSHPQPRAELVSRHDVVLQPFHLPEAALLGAHQQDNLAVAVSLARAAGFGDAAIEQMKRFPGLSHRLENVGTFHGVRVVNDSKATALESVLIAAQSCLAEDQQLHLLLGGKDKNLPWKMLSIFAGDPRIKPVFFGQCGAIAQKQSGLSGPCFNQLGEAIAYCLKNCSTGDTVLLSPGGTSMDEFKNFEERGDFFTRFVVQNQDLIRRGT